jgi:hypothetical protein
MVPDNEISMSSRSEAQCSNSTILQLDQALSVYLLLAMNEDMGTCQQEMIDGFQAL